MGRYSILPASLVLIMASVSASETHDVIVGNHFFNPQQLTIAAGDSVRWTNHGGDLHNVAADDGSFRCAEGCDGDAGGSGSPSTSNWSVTLTFDEPGQIGYHCQAHGSPGVAMWGSITVEASDEPPPEESGIAINQGLAGSWFNPETGGQGFLLDVVVGLEPPLLVIYWFTYDLLPGDASSQRWMLVDGRYQPGDVEVELDVYQFTGGAFDQDDEVTGDVIGSALVSFESCTSGELEYELLFDGDESEAVSGRIPIVPISPDIADRCQASLD